MALTFILNIDEMICETLTTSATRFVLEHLEEMPLYDDSEHEGMSYEESIGHHETGGNNDLLRNIRFAFPMKLCVTIALTALIVGEYYMRNCNKTEDGRYVSVTMHFPASISYSVLAFLFPR